MHGLSGTAARLTHNNVIIQPMAHVYTVHSEGSKNLKYLQATKFTYKIWSVRVVTDHAPTIVLHVLHDRTPGGAREAQEGSSLYK
jgi:hypothetical protein